MSLLTLDRFLINTPLPSAFTCINFSSENFLFPIQQQTDLDAQSSFCSIIFGRPCFIIAVLFSSVFKFGHSCRCPFEGEHLPVTKQSPSHGKLASCFETIGCPFRFAVPALFVRP